MRSGRRDLKLERWKGIEMKDICRGRGVYGHVPLEEWAVSTHILLWNCFLPSWMFLFFSISHVWGRWDLTYRQGWVRWRGCGKGQEEPVVLCVDHTVFRWNAFISISLICDRLPLSWEDIMSLHLFFSIFSFPSSTFHCWHFVCFYPLATELKMRGVYK